MKIVRVAIAILLSLAVMFIARTNSRGRPELVQIESNSFVMSMTTVPKITEHKSGRVTCEINGILPEGASVVFRTNQPNSAEPSDWSNYESIVMSPSGDNGYFVDVVADVKGGRFYYYYEIIDSNEVVMAQFIDAEGKPWFLRYIGEVPIAVLGGHLIFILLTVFTVVMAAIYSLSLMRGGTTVKPAAFWTFSALVACFVGCYPFGIPMNWYAFGGLWEGIPFGTDATDNKTQLLFVYLIYATLATLGSLKYGKSERDFHSPKTSGIIGVGSFLVMLFIYFIPHSIQFSKLFTYSFCYAWTAILAGLIFYGYSQSNKSANLVTVK